MGQIVPFPIPETTEQHENYYLLTEPFIAARGEEEGVGEVYEKAVVDRIGNIEQELLKFFHESMLASSCRHKIDKQRLLEEQEERIPELGTLEELVVFSPEIQGKKTEEETSNGDGDAPKLWGDVFLRIGEEYPFLFTAYTADYVREQNLLYGEEIKPSPKDVILKRPHLSPEDILRAMIKWVNLYCPTLKGRAISLEDDATLESLICDPGVEIVWCEPS